MSISTADQPRSIRRYRRYTEWEAMHKIYIIKSAGVHGYLNVPKVLIGKRVKLIEVLE